MRDVYDLIGRTLLSAAFIFEAFDSIYHFDDTQTTMTTYGFDSKQDTVLILAIIMLLAGGLMVLTGYRAKLGALLLIIYWLPITFLVHDFWNCEKQDDMRLQSILFMRDLAIIGGLLLLISKKTGRYSIRKIFATTKV